MEKPWAIRAAGYLPGIQQLSDAKWGKIYELATELIKLPEGVETVDSSRDNEDPRSRVLLSDELLWAFGEYY